MQVSIFRSRQAESSMDLVANNMLAPGNMLAVIWDSTDSALGICSRFAVRGARKVINRMKDLYVYWREHIICCEHIR